MKTIQEIIKNEGTDYLSWFFENMNDKCKYLEVNSFNEIFEANRYKYKQYLRTQKLKKCIE